MTEDEARGAIIAAVAQLHNSARELEELGESPSIAFDMIAEGIFVGLSENLDRARQVRNWLIAEIDLQADLAQTVLDSPIAHPA